MLSKNNRKYYVKTEVTYEHHFELLADDIAEAIDMAVGLTKAGEGTVCVVSGPRAVEWSDAA